MPLYTLDCFDCSEPCEVFRKNGKYCRACALLRKLMYAVQTVPQAHRNCRVCATKFAPLHARDYLCGLCDPPQGDAGTCSVCHADRPLPHRGVAVCLACIKGFPKPKPRQDPDEAPKHHKPGGRPAVIAALQKGQAARRAANANRPPRPIALVNRDTATANP